MASLKCSFCGKGIHYHGIPNGIKYIFCSLSDWQTLENENLNADCLELEHYEKFIKAWKCPKCGTFAFFDDRVHVGKVYTPKKTFSTNSLQNPINFGVFFEDYTWDKITESDIPTKEILQKFPHQWLLKNADEIWIFSDKNMQKCLAQYYEIEIAPDITR